MIGQTANILQFLGPRLGLVPKDQASRLWVHQLQLTVTDWVAEVGNTHHPIANVLYYEEQKDEAKRRTSYFTSLRIPKFMGYYEKIFQKNPSKHATFYSANRFATPTYRCFKWSKGCATPFPRAMAKVEPSCPRVVARP